MARKNEKTPVKLVEISGVFNAVFSLDEIGAVQDILDHLRGYGDADVTAIREVEGDERRD